ncbi:uncharacterized protein LOC123550604 [Mercenaria mercenaria]|uniref:uncharacterized protein LOC123550604 n=1 Tax=Mercenaria mercenaria TaxID=6596 RepID=UPI00234F236C|nr:uncharacterized protein LOC123550604 [Mercenaria mercenaria]
MIMKLGKSALIAKRDLKSAYRILPLAVSDFPLFGLKVGDCFYVDKFLPMGLSQSANLFEKFSTFLNWLVCATTRIDTVDHMLDDFIFAGSKGSNDCHTLVSAFTGLCNTLGVPIADDKSVGPTTIMLFLGLEIDTNEMLVRIPIHKVDELVGLHKGIMNRKKVSLKELQRLVGKLNSFGQAIRSSRAFTRRFYDAMSGLRKQFYLLRVTEEIREDVKVWLSFLQEFNGVSYIPENFWYTSDQLQLFSDSAGSADMEAACYFEGRWSLFPWPESLKFGGVLKDLTFLEMVPVILAMFLWGRDLMNKNITLRIDNEALVLVLNKQTSKSKRVMQLVRPFVTLAMRYNIWFKAVHISSKNNAIADAISRQQWSRFRQLVSEAENYPEMVPQQFLSLVSEMKLTDC